EDRLDRAHRFAGTAVDAFVGVDVQHPFPFIDAVDWALIDAGLVLHVDTRFSNDVSHAPPSKTIFPLVSHYGYYVLAGVGRRATGERALSRRGRVFRRAGLHPSH